MYGCAFSSACALTFQGTCRTQSGFGRTVLVLVLVIDTKKTEYEQEYEYEG
jgi:hypothetical protein